MSVVQSIFQSILISFSMFNPEISERTEELMCLSTNIWFEARGTSKEDKRAIAHVVLNREQSKRYPNDICAVVYQPYQFSWTHDGVSDRIELDNPIDEKAWSESVLTAAAVMSGYSDDISDGATHYHADYVEPYWAKSYYVSYKNDSHTFYTETDITRIRAEKAAVESVLATYDRKKDRFDIAHEEDSQALYLRKWRLF